MRWGRRRPSASAISNKHANKTHRITELETETETETTEPGCKDLIM